MKNNQASVPLNIICFFFPWIGLIVYLCLGGIAPARARSVGKASTAGAILVVAFYIALSFASQAFFSRFYGNIMAEGQSIAIDNSMPYESIPASKSPRRK